MFRRIHARFKKATFKSWLGIAGLWGAGLLLPCPDCGGRMLLHFWPLALVFTLLNLRRDKKPSDAAGTAHAAEMTDDPGTTNDAGTSAAPDAPGTESA